MTGLSAIVRKGKKRTSATTEPPAAHEDIPERVLDELVHAKTAAKDYAAAFGDAVKKQAEKYGLKVAALRQYVAARESDKTEEKKAEVKDLADLLG